MTKVTERAKHQTAHALPALRRAARRAREIARQTGTPLWVIKNGKLVDLMREEQERRKR